MTDPTPDGGRAPESPAAPAPAPPPAPDAHDRPTTELPVQPATPAPTPPDTPPAAPSPAVAPAGDDKPRPSPAPRHAAPTTERTGHPRRWFLAGAGAAVLAAAGGTGVALLRDRPAKTPDPAPAALLAAIAAERALLADLVATTGGTPDVRLVLAGIVTNHDRHLSALQALVAAEYTAAAVATATTTPAPGTPRTRAQLRAAEQRAATTAASHASSLDGRTATLLASIAACEASHAELLS